ncbi:MAG: hypothetical protein FWC47_13365 [Oscillospiraceae bacterium]|nr:hypothetical protein [Oscillospiraceae bacterium]
MTPLKEKAIKMLQDIPDDKMIYVIDILRSLNNLLISENTNYNNIPASSAIDDNSEALEAWEGLKKYHGIIRKGIDEKEELLKARDEKYAE